MWLWSQGHKKSRSIKRPRRDSPIFLPSCRNILRSLFWNLSQKTLGGNASGLTTCLGMPEPTRTGPAPLPPRGPFLPASQRCSWIAPATPGAELGQAPTRANLQSGMPELARGAACLGPWAILKEPEGLRGPGVSAPSWGQTPGRFCDLHTCSGRSALKVCTESLSPTVGE